MLVSVLDILARPPTIKPDQNGNKDSKFWGFLFFFQIALNEAKLKNTYTYLWEERHWLQEDNRICDDGGHGRGRRREQASWSVEVCPLPPPAAPFQGCCRRAHPPVIFHPISPFCSLSLSLSLSPLESADWKWCSQVLSVFFLFFFLDQWFCYLRTFFWANLICK